MENSDSKGMPKNEGGVLINTEVRGSGRTTHAILSAPVSAVYVVANRSDINRVTVLAANNDRADLTIIPVDRIFEYCVGRNLTGLILDHRVADVMTRREMADYKKGLAFVRPKRAMAKGTDNKE